MENVSLRDYIAMFRRRKLEFVLSALAFFVLCVAFAYLWPPKYRSTATIQIEQPDIPQGMLVPQGMEANVVEAFADQRIEQIHQKMTAESNLVDIITKFNLYAEDRRLKPMTRIVEDMRKAIKLELLSTDLANPMSVQRLNPAQLAAIAFTISFDYQTPLIAQQVANELVTRFVDEDIKVRREQAKDTSSFFGTEITTLEASMAEQEQKISDYKAEHAGGMPEELPINMQLAATAQQNLLEQGRELTTLQKSRGDLMAQLATTEPYSRVIADGQVLTTPAIQLKALQAKYATMTGQYGPAHPDVLKLKHQIDALQAESDASQPDTANIEAQIADVKTNLAAAEKTYSPDHPDVKALRKQLKALEARKDQATGAQADHGLAKKDADNPAYLMIKSQLDGIDSQVASLTTERDETKKQLDLYQQRIAETPVVEREYEALARDYDNSQLRYRELKEKKMAADMNQTMEQGRKAERLDVIDAPDLPDRPHFPPRIIVIAVGFVFSFFAGAGGIGLAESMSRSVHGVRHVAELTGATPLITVPHIFTKQEIWRSRLLGLEIAGGLVVLCAGAGWLFDQYVMPLDVFWTLVEHKFGIT
jgi:uncharacterized protein involved in exopolysaccharide biosynthesis